jgi:hypothetical protein
VERDMCAVRYRAAVGYYTSRIMSSDVSEERAATILGVYY